MCIGAFNNFCNNFCMKNLLLLFFICLLPVCITPARTEQYGLYSPQDYKENMQVESGERILFILDFSNSMTETLEGSRKVDLMLDTMKEILPKISSANWVGLRIYGHRMGITPVEACRASVLVSPILRNNGEHIEHSLFKAKPRGMTPITYSLKQAVKYDFMGFRGKKHIILLTDGGENCDESPCKFVMNLIKIRRDVTIDVIAFNVQDADDLEQLRCTALVTSGRFYNARTAAELLNGFNDSVEGAKSVEAKIITH